MNEEREVELMRLRVMVIQFCAGNCIWNVNGCAHENTLNCEHCGFNNACMYAALLREVTK